MLRIIFMIFGIVLGAVGGVIAYRAYFLEPTAAIVISNEGVRELPNTFRIVGGLLLLIGRFVPLGLTILAAIIVNIWAFHLLMAPEGLPPAVVVTIFELFLVWSYRDRFAGILRP